MDIWSVDVNATARRTEGNLSTIAYHDHAPSAPSSLVAPPWHTAVLVAFFILLALTGARFQSARAHSLVPQQHADATMLYVSLIAGQWGLLYYVWKGAGCHRNEPADRRPVKTKDVA